ncbi:MAG: MFS transporter [Chitinophagaceae bacterium]
MLQASVRLYKNAYSGIPKEVWWLGLVLLINRSGTMVIPFLTVYLTGRGFSLGEAGLIMGIFGCGSILGGFLGGWLSDRYGFFKVQVASLFMNGILFVILGYMQELWQIAICIFALSSLGDAFRPANAAAVAAYSNEQNRTRCYSLNRLATNLGWAIGPAVGGLLASYNYHLLFWTDGLTCLSAAFMMYFLFAAHQKPAKKRKETTAELKGGSAYKDLIYLKGLFLLLLITICFFQLFSMIPVFYKSEVHLNEATIGFILGLNGLIIAIIEMVLVYKIENKKQSTYYMAIGGFLIGSSFLLLTINPSLFLVLAGVLVITFGEMFLFPFTNAFWVGRSQHHNRGQYAALYTMTFALGQVLAPTIAAQIALHYGFASLFRIDFLLCALAATGFYFFKKH